MDNIVVIVLVVVTLVFGVLRFVLPVSGTVNKADIYKDLAHLYVGGLFGAWLAAGDTAYLLLALGLTVLEVVAFIVRRKR